ncbi:MAG: hypothetical protein QXD55_00395 [Candidatus Aenigmatarchaeota archaeon]
MGKESEKMILGINDAKKFIENGGEPEGAGFDIRVGEVYSIKNDTFLGIEERKTSDIKLIAKFGKEKYYILKPEEYVLIKTIERVKIPKNIVMLTFPRSTLQRCGVLLIATQTSPGYCGELTFGLKNLSKNNFKLELGARIAHLIFFEVRGKTKMYKGAWQGGKVSTKGKEKQI